MTSRRHPEAGHPEAGSALIEFAFLAPAVLLLLVGTAYTGANIDRYLEVEQLARAAASLHAAGTDFSLPEKRALLSRAATTLNLSESSGDTVVYLSTVAQTPEGPRIVRRFAIGAQTVGESAAGAVKPQYDGFGPTARRSAAGVRGAGRTASVSRGGDPLAPRPHASLRPRQELSAARPRGVLMSRSRQASSARGGDRRGALVIMAVLVLPVVLLTVGLALDGGLLYMTDARLATAARGAAHSALRGADAEQAEALARSVFDANFPEGALMAQFQGIDSFEVQNGEVRLTASAQAPTLFMRFLGEEVVRVRRSARAKDASSGEPVRLLADSDAFGPDLREIQDLARFYPHCGNGDPAVCVNADQGGDTALFTRGNDITPYENLSLHMGTVEDPAFFQLDGSPLSEAAAERLIGRTVCAEVFQEDFTVESPPQRQGRTAFDVTGLTPAPEGRAYSPHWVVRLLPARTVDRLCGGGAAN